MFIETALKQVSDWQADSLPKGVYGICGLPPIPENDITWIVAEWNYSAWDLRKFGIVARERGINYQTISNKQQLFDYINKEGRSEDLIEAMTFFSHGTAFDVGTSNPGYEGKYAISMGYGGKGIHNNDLNIFLSDINKINSGTFANNLSSVFYSCRTGTSFNDEVFAQNWANVTGSNVRAAVSRGNDSILTGRTDYYNIYPNPIHGLDTFCSITGLFQSPRQKDRDMYGFSKMGSKNYPTITDGGSWDTFYPND